jgi:hypothetical protein
MCLVSGTGHALSATSVAEKAQLGSSLAVVALTWHHQIGMPTPCALCISYISAL